MIFGLLTALACHAPMVPSTTGPVTTGHLVVAHTNDLHAHFSPSRANWIDGSPEIGGFAQIGGHVTALHQTHGDDHVLYLDGGDILTGTPLMEFDVHGAKGGAILDFMAGAGMDAWVVGNHEFDLGYENIQTLVRSSRVPVLSANLDAVDGSGAPGIAGLRDHIIFDRAGLRIGVFGLTTSGLARLTSSDVTTRMNVVDVVVAAQEQVEILERQVDLVVALTHTGLDVDKRLAEEVSGIDLIVGGHSHTSLTEPVRVGETWIVQAGSYARQLGVAEMTITDGRITEFSAGLRDLTPGVVEPHADLLALEKTWRDRIDAKFSEVVGEVSETLGRGPRQDSALGRWSADMLRAATDAQIGIYNPGGLRADLSKGPLSLKALYEVFPFTNAVVRFDMTGGEVIGLLLRNASAELNGNRAVMQLSGLRATWRVRSDAPELVEVNIGAVPVDPDGTYSAVTNSYVVDQWEYNLGFEPRNAETLDLGVFDAATLVARQGPVSPPPNPRFVRID